MAKETAEKKYIFYSKSENMMVGAEELQPEKRTVDGRITRDSGLIQFINGFYETNDPKVAEHIKETNSFKIGKIRQITPEEQMKLYQVKQAKLKAIVTGVDETATMERALNPMEAIDLAIGKEA